MYILSVLEEKGKNNETEIKVSLKIEITESFEKLKRKNGSNQMRLIFQGEKIDAERPTTKHILIK